MKLQRHGWVEAVVGRMYETALFTCPFIHMCFSQFIPKIITTRQDTASHFSEVSYLSLFQDCQGRLGDYITLAGTGTHQ